MNFGIRNKIALVTAASKGLGKAAAQALAREGASLVICSRTEKDILATADEIRREWNVPVEALAADVSDGNAVNAVVEFAKRKYGTVHILVNNAGGPPAGDILSLTDDAWQQGNQLTLMSMVRFTRAVLPMMIQQHWGRILTITSIAGKQPINELLLSSAIRPGIHGLTKVLSNEYAQYNITINTICPGNILTKRQEELGSVRAAKQKISMEQYFKDLSANIPAGRLGRPEEIGDVIAFLASEQAGYINGVNLLVDGGAAKGIH